MRSALYAALALAAFGCDKTLPKPQKPAEDQPSRIVVLETAYLPADGAPGPRFWIVRDNVTGEEFLIVRDCGVDQYENPKGKTP